MIHPFQCTPCNASLVVVDAPTIICRFCDVTNEVHEAFLSPATIEELDALRTDKHPQKRRAAGTRGWYDHVTEPVNFLVPLMVTLMFVAIEAIVLTGRVFPK